MSIIRYATMAAGGLLVSAASALAGPIYTFTTSEGVQPSDVGTITLTQVSGTTVNVLVDLADTSLPAPRYGFLNTGGPHTPFAFTLAGTEVGVSATFLQPVGGVFGTSFFLLNLGGGGATPYGDYGVAIDSSAGNGSGNAYYGDLQFNLTRTSGLDTADFIIGTDALAYFAADLTDGGSNTGSQAWKTRTTPPGDDPGDPRSVPGPIVGAGLPGLIVACLGLVGLARRRRKAAIA